MNKSDAQLKCGYCGWLVQNHCENLWEHQCFANFNEKKDLIEIDESSNVTGIMSIEELQKKWKYHRECYIRARKKIKQYVPSGSDALPHNFKNSYRFFELMKPLHDILQTESTVSTLSVRSQSPVSDESVSSDIHLSTNVSVSMISPYLESSMESDDSNTIFQTPTSLVNRPVRTPTPNSTNAKKRKVDDQSFAMQSAILDILKTPIPEMDAVDGFLKTLGEVLRRLPYEKRARLQIKLLTMAVNEEMQ